MFQHKLPFIHEIENSHIVFSRIDMESDWVCLWRLHLYPRMWIAIWVPVGRTRSCLDFGNYGAWLYLV